MRSGRFNTTVNDCGGPTIGEGYHLILLQSRITIKMTSFNIKIVLGVLFVLTISSTNTSETNYAFARVESCSGCRLKSLPDVKQFIFEDVPLYDNVEFKHIQGAPPELLFFNENEEEVERLKLSHLTREECNQLLKSKGFKKRTPILKDEI